MSADGTDRVYGDRDERVGLGDRLRVYRDGILGRLDRVVLPIYDAGSRKLLRDKPELQPYYEEAVRESPGLARAALILDTADFIPFVSIVATVGDALLVKSVPDYVKDKTGGYGSTRTKSLASLATEAIGAFIPGFPLEYLPTSTLLVMDAYRQVAEYRYNEDNPEEGE